MVAMSNMSKVDGRRRAGRFLRRLTTTQTTAIQAIVPAIPMTFHASGQSGRVPQSLTVPTMSHSEISGAARESIARSEL